MIAEPCAASTASTPCSRRCAPGASRRCASSPRADDAADGAGRAWPRSRTSRCGASAPTSSIALPRRRRRIRAWSPTCEDGRALQRRGSGRSARTGAPLIVVLDGIEDPHNVGAILRTVDAAGADGVVRQSRHAAPLDGAAAKASAGAVSHVKIAEVVNIARALEELKRPASGPSGWPATRRSATTRSTHAADGPRRRRRRDRPAPAGARAVRLAGVDPDARPRREPERVGGDRNRPVRGRLGSGARNDVMIQ